MNSAVEAVSFCPRVAVEIPRVHFVISLEIKPVKHKP